jgi:phosphoglycerate-specific signal transduction histidine kinase
MRLTVGNKIIAGIAMIILVATLALLIVYGGLSRVVDSMRELAEVEEPSHSATLEVELNVNGIVFAVLAYLDVPDRRHREMVQKDQRDVAAFHTRFLRLAESEPERALAARLGALYQELQTLGDSLMDTRDRQASVWTRVTRQKPSTSLVESGKRQRHNNLPHPTARQRR